MRRIGSLVLAAALLGAAPVWAQSEMEIYQQTGDGLLAAHREATQRNINGATKALQAKDYATAKKYALTVSRQDPKRVEPWLMLGAAETGLQDWPAARKAYTAAVKISPIHVEARAGLGIAQARLKDSGVQRQLSWLTKKAEECGGCWQAGQLAKYKSDVETAVADAAKAP